MLQFINIVISFCSSIKVRWKIFSCKKYCHTRIDVLPSKNQALCKHYTHIIYLLINPLTRFLALHFYAPKTHKPKNWLYNACLDKTFPCSRNASTILIQLSLSNSPLNSRSDGSYHPSLQGKLLSSARFKSFIFHFSSMFITTPLWKSGHNLAVIPPTDLCLPSSCSSRDSATDGVFCIT